MESHSWELEDMEATQGSILLKPINSTVEITEIQEEKDKSITPKVNDGCVFYTVCVLLLCR